jgi:hypothetical protein
MKPVPDIYKEFTGAMLDIYRRSLNETGVKHTYFFQMIDRSSGHEAAMQLIHSKKPSDGYADLHSKGRLDLTVEALVLQRKWDSIFTADDRAKARARLADYSFDFAKYGLT